MFHMRVGTESLVYTVSTCNIRNTDILQLVIGLLLMIMMMMKMENNNGRRNNFIYFINKSLNKLKFTIYDLPIITVHQDLLQINYIFSKILAIYRKLKVLQ